MVSNENCEINGDIEECNSNKVKGQIPLDVSTSLRGLITDEDRQNQSSDRAGGFTDKLRFFKLGGSLGSPSLRFQRIFEERDEASRKVPSSSSLRQRVSKLFSRKIDWNSVQKLCKEWISNPLNMALLIWIVFVAISGAILFLVMTGMLNRALPKKSQRDAWFEVNNQILNALFTLMCLYQHPKRFYHLVLLLRWRPGDITKLRKIYCKNGTYKPHEWAHMMVVLILLHINCFAQYGLCALNWGFRRSERPAVGVGVCVSLAIAAPAIAGMYCTLSPLGRDYDSGLDEEAPAERSDQSQLKRKSFEKRFSFALRDDARKVDTSPKWSGGILDFWDDIPVAYLSLFCTFCVFGWNMERLGFGNMYVHIATFLLFCLAPFFIFNLAAVNIDNESVREALGITGLFLCLFGLLYGGFWRIQMRKRFNLPQYTFCCNKASVTDCALWLCCCWCSLAQEVRTGNAYDVVEDKFCKKQVEESDQMPISPLPREEGEFQFRSSPNSPLRNITSPPARSPSPGRFTDARYSPVTSPSARSPSPSRFTNARYSPAGQLSSVEEESYHHGKNEIMTPPAHPMIRREEK